jgi:hypothetical protein
MTALRARILVEEDHQTGAENRDAISSSLTAPADSAAARLKSALIQASMELSDLPAFGKAYSSVLAV